MMLPKCDCPVCSDGPLEKACAVSWSIVLCAAMVEKSKRGQLAPGERDEVLGKVWRMLERAGFTPEEARNMVRDLK